MMSDIETGRSVVDERLSAIERGGRSTLSGRGVYGELYGYWNPQDEDDPRTKFLKAAVAKKDTPFDKLTDLDKAFLEGAKQFTTVACAAINGLNVFATTMAFKVEQKNINNSREGPYMKVAFKACTIICFSFTLCAAAFSYATKYHPSWIGLVAWSVGLEMLYLCLASSMFAYYLGDSEDGLPLFITGLVAFVVLFGAMVYMFKRPRHHGRRNKPPEAAL